jgi:hypothetical protein
MSGIFFESRLCTHGVWAGAAAIMTTSSCSSTVFCLAASFAALRASRLSRLRRWASLRPSSGSRGSSTGAAAGGSAAVDSCSRDAVRLRLRESQTNIRAYYHIRL